MSARQTIASRFRRTFRPAILPLVIALYASPVESADLSLGPLSSAGREYAAYASDAAPPEKEHSSMSPTPEQMQRRTLGIILGGAAALGVYGKTHWWQNGFDSGFHTASEGWFGQNTYAGGADKFGHLYMTYAVTRLFSRAYEWAGNTPDASLRMAAVMTLSAFTAVEILDGMTQKWRFSKEDAIMNAVGVGAALLLEKNPAIDRVLDLRLQYWPSPENRHNFDPFGDYSGQTYLLVAKASGIPALREHHWLRYLEFAVGYGSRGYGDPQSAVNSERSRNVYVGISLNLSEVLRDSVFRHSFEPSRPQRFTETFLEYVQVPGTAALHAHRLPPD
ncbi:MAG: DUF2279 domain-containing protein [Noviherbaspirillum sp.]